MNLQLRWLVEVRRLGLVLGLVLAPCVASGAPHAQPHPPAPACGQLVPFLVLPSDFARAEIIYGQAGDRPLLYLDGLRIVAGGAPNAYHPLDWPGLDALANARGEDGWAGLATNRFGRPFVQTAMDPAPGFYVSTTALTDREIADLASPARYVDATRVPYIALPGGKRAKAAYAGAGIQLGDLALVYNIRLQTIAPAVFADFAPSSRLGEGSIELAERLGYADTSPRHGGTAAPENLTLVFPGSGAGFPHDLKHLEKTAALLLDDWGGKARLEACAGVLR